MNLNITGVHLEVTSSLRDYLTEKLDRVTRHVDNVIAVNVALSVVKLDQKVAVDVHLKGKDIHVEEVASDMYAAIDLVIDKIDRQVLKYKEKQTTHFSDKAHKANELSAGSEV